MYSRLETRRVGHRYILKLELKLKMRRVQGNSFPSPLLWVSVGLLAALDHIIVPEGQGGKRTRL